MVARYYIKLNCMLIRIISFAVKFGGSWYFNLFGSTIT